MRPIAHMMIYVSKVPIQKQCRFTTESLLILYIEQTKCLLRIGDSGHHTEIGQVITLRQSKLEHSRILIS